MLICQRKFFLKQLGQVDSVNVAVWKRVKLAMERRYLLLASEIIVGRSGSQ